MPVKAEARTIVVPDDYPTISEAIRNANDGDTILVKKGTYEEKTLEINKRLSLIGEGAESTKINLDPPLIKMPSNYPIIDPTPFWIYSLSVKVDANDFKLSGFTINTTGGAISITGNRTQIVSNHITTPVSINGLYSNVAENTISNTVSVGSYSSIVKNTLKGASAVGAYTNVSGNNIVGGSIGIGEGLYNIISSNNIKGGGIQIRGGSSCLIYDNNLTAGGSFIVGGKDNIVSRNIVDHLDFGLAVGGSNNTVFSNQVTHCGIALSPRAGSVYYANYIANNLWGIDTGDTELNPTGNASTLFYNNFVNNVYQVSTVLNAYSTDYFDNGQEGNYWSDYHGKDADGDGIGDTPYVIDDNRSDRYPLMAPFDIDSVTVELPEWASPPSVHLISPENTTYTSANVTLNFTVNKQTSWIGYSLDGQETVTVTGNTTLAGLSWGLHNVTVYAKDLLENTGNSDTVWFNVAEPFPTTLIITASGVSVAVVSIGLLVYFKKRKR